MNLKNIFPRVINRFFYIPLESTKKKKHPNFDQSPTPSLSPESFDYDNQESANFIFSELNQNKPYMISRFGSVELNAITRCIAIKSGLLPIKIQNFLNDKIDNFYFNKDTFEDLYNNAGFFPCPKKNDIKKFTKIYIDAMKDIDILGSWHYKEKYVADFLSPQIKKIPLWHLEPYYFDKPAWSRVLKGKKILVIHPFSETIQAQYNKNRTKLFSNPDILPDFELQTLKSVQSIAGNRTDFKNWFDALEYMKEQIASKDFDVAIIGCGAYGMPLASYVKSLGKQAIHLGGAVQILFGIKGKRWDGLDFYKNMYNEYWVRPNSNEIPDNCKNVENGCYW